MEHLHSKYANVLVLVLQNSIILLEIHIGKRKLGVKSLGKSFSEKE